MIANWLLKTQKDEWNRLNRNNELDDRRWNLEYNIYRIEKALDNNESIEVILQ